MKYLFCTDRGFFEVDRDTNKINRRTQTVLRTKIDRYIDEIHFFLRLESRVYESFEEAKQVALRVEKNFLKLVQNKNAAKDKEFVKEDYIFVAIESGFSLEDTESESYSLFQEKFDKREEKIQEQARKDVKAHQQFTIPPKPKYSEFPQVKVESGAGRETESSLDPEKKLFTEIDRLKAAVSLFVEENRRLSIKEIAKQAKCTRVVSAEFLNKYYPNRNKKISIKKKQSKKKS